MLTQAQPRQTERSASLSSGEAQVFWVKPETVPQFWTLGEYFIKQACKRGPGRLIPDNLKASCEAGYSQYMVAVLGGECVAAAVTNVTTDWPTGHKVLEWTAIGGRDYRNWQHLESVVIEAAKQHGCMTMRTYSRVGMQRLLKAKGFKPVGVILEKELV